MTMIVDHNYVHNNPYVYGNVCRRHESLHGLRTVNERRCVACVAEAEKLRRERDLARAPRVRKEVPVDNGLPCAPAQPITYLTKHDTGPGVAECLAERKEYLAQLQAEKRRRALRREEDAALLEYWGKHGVSRKRCA